MRMKAVSALLSISCCAGLFLPSLGLHTSRWDRLRITASAKEPSFDDLFAQGTAYVQSGELGLAVGCFQGASQLDPSHEPTQKLLAKLAPFMTSVEAEAPEEEEEEEGSVCVCVPPRTNPPRCPCVFTQPPSLSSPMSSTKSTRRSGTSISFFRICLAVEIRRVDKFGLRVTSRSASSHFPSLITLPSTTRAT